MLFCPDAADKDFNDDWIPTHELFHLGNPDLSRRVPWFTEGVATYYQDVLRGRTHNQDPVAMWGDMYDGFRRYCDPSWWVPLETESGELRRRHHYQRVYWGGACLMFRADVAIREHSHGARSLDDVAQLISLIDQAAGRPVAREQLSTKQAVPMKELYQRLGIEPTGSDTVRLHDDAPLAWVRKGIFQ
jgi:predicted metalloprotease with PDZ domain